MDPSAVQQFQEVKKKSKLAKIPGRESDQAPAAIFSLGASSQNTHAMYRSLYRIDLEQELAKWALPLSQKPKPSRAVLTSALLPPLPQQALPAEEESEEDEEEQGDEFDARGFYKLFGDVKGETEATTGLAYSGKNDVWMKELSKVKTGEDAIAFFAKKGNQSPVKFVHCVKTPDTGKLFRPYDLVVVPETEIRQDYYTISAQGVVHIHPEVATTFYSLADWMHQSKMFNLLTNMSFFRHYLTGKMFKYWRGNVRYRLFCSTRKRLVRQLFHAKPAFSPALLEANGLLFEMTTPKMMEIKENRVMDISEYDSNQRDQRADAKKSFEATVEKLISQLETVCQAVKESAIQPEIEELEQNKFGQQSKKKSMVKMKEEERKRRQHLELAREHEDMLGDYIRLFDYMVIETLVLITQNCTLKFYKEMTERKTKLFITTVNYDKTSITFTPNEEDFHGTLDGILDGLVNEIDKVNRILYHKTLEQHASKKQVTDHPYVKQILEKSQSFSSCRLKIHDKVSTDFVEARSFVGNTFEKARPIYEYMQTWTIDAFKSQQRSVPTLREELGKMRLWRDQLAEYMPLNMPGSFKAILNIDGKKIKNQLNNDVENAFKELKNYIINLYNTKATEFNDALKNFNKKLRAEPTKLPDFIKFVEDYNDANARQKSILETKANIEEIFTLAKKKDSAFQDSALKTDLKDELEENFKQFIETNLGKASSFIEASKLAMSGKFEKTIEKLDTQLKELSESLDEGTLISVETSPDDALAELNSLEKKLEKYKDHAKKYQHYQEVLQVKAISVKQLQRTDLKYQNKRKLWEIKQAWGELFLQWFHHNFTSVDKEQMESTVKKNFSTLNQLMETLGKKEKGEAKEKDQVAEELLSKVKQVKEILPVVKELGNPFLKLRHWENIFAKLDNPKPYDPDAAYTLQQLIDFGCMGIKEFIEETSGVASGEAQIENSVEDIRKSWAETNFTLANYRDMKDRFVIRELDDTLTMLEDHQVLVQTMLGSRYVNAIRGVVDEWDKKLKVVHKTIEEWLSCQKQWQYLENIFSAPDIKKQLPTEASKFETVDKFWRETMIRTHKNPLIIEAATIEGLYDKFVKNNVLLDEIKKSLDEYLESKRRCFPRFYFLADEELLEILSQTRNPKTVQNHLRKCFDNMDKIVFEGDTNMIIGMISGENERVSFSAPVIAEGNVEFWLLKIEEMMRGTLKDLTLKAFQIYPKNGLERKEWFFEMGLPAQPILTVDMIMWTFNATQAIMDVTESRNKGAIKEFYEYSAQQINKMVEIVRGQLTYLQRTLIGALIVLDVHARDVIGGLLRLEVESVHDFEWSRQLRYYWETEINDCRVKQTNASFLYGYEYLGNNPRLVITPLTDKCYMTLTGALHLYYGGNPAGPAGTGKTETTKDLGKALAIQCVVFNCSDGLDVKIMGRFFSGLAQAGAWSCFDEFNRIDIEVLSVIAQQMLTIQQAVRGKVDEFEFGASIIPLNRRFGVFITMNPGYAGRTELPDNLKALFRPMAMMIPDYAMIAEIILFSEGFQQARGLSQKMVQLYKLASEQLSKQDHYDFGMRAVKSVLVMAGQLRRRDSVLSEDVVLIRAMRDSNVPKFLSHDLPLFSGIIHDLFPEATVPFIDYGNLKRAIENQLTVNDFMKPDNYVTKIIQLLETMLVRHGNMLVGSAGTGKSTVYRTLASSLTQLNEEGSPDSAHQKVHYYPLNPKAITLGELYGQVSRTTGDFTDGIVPILVRAAKDDQTLSKKWIVFDGPVDAVWIESMNTVLDDNKMLCLVNGERIKLPDTITMLFEVNDLAQASPATVSRCGMVYLEPIHLGLDPIIETWMLKYKRKKDDKEEVPHIITNAIKKSRNLLKDLIKFIREECKEEIPTMDMNIVTSFLRILGSNIDLEKLETRRRPDETEKLLGIYIIFSLIWSVGANLNDLTRGKFDKVMRLHIDSFFDNFPREGTVYDYCIDEDTLKFVSWIERVPQYFYNSKIAYFNILVPTMDTVRYRFLMDVILKSSGNVLFSGNTGVGKSVIVKDYLDNYNDEKFASFNVNFSAQTSTQNLYDMLESKLKDRGKKEFGPLRGSRMAIFVDDVNMPAPDLYGSQPPVELLRQVVESGYYDLKKFSFKNVADVQFVSACAPPGGGRNVVTPRLFRHFQMIWQPQLSALSMEMIFSSILRGFLENHPDVNLSDFADMIVKSSVEMYAKICNDLLPTPSKSHYTFNLRDLSKIVQGILQINYDNLRTSETLILLWTHETQRVFRDRLIDDKDRIWFNDMLEKKMKENIAVDVPREMWENVLFGDYMADGLKEYIKIDYGQDLFSRLSRVLDMYNGDNNNQMNLVFFKDAIMHLSRVSRVIRQPRGNALLVGVGGSGRQSLARLAIFLAGFKCFTIEITRSYGPALFHEDLKNLLTKAGAENEPTCFLFSDTQIVKESFLEDINNILNTGEVPNLFEENELEIIKDKVAPLAKEAGKTENAEGILGHFVQLVRENLHIILAFSPVGDLFRVRCRQFPSIINCCTIDWYNIWPNEALFSVAKKIFELNTDVNLGQYSEQMSNTSVKIHSTVTDKCEEYYQELRRRTYTTPTSYLELLQLFVSMMRHQQKLVPEKINRYKAGLQRLTETNAKVADLRKMLIELQPVLEQNKIDNAKLMEELKIKQGEAQVTREMCAKEEAECASQMREVLNIKEDCEKDLAEAIPAYNKAIKALDTLDKSKIVEMKGYTTPPPLVEVVMNAVLVLFKRPQSWDEGKRLLNEMNFLDQCKTFDKDGISNAIISKLSKFINDPQFVVENVERVSVAAGSLCQWATAMYKFAKVSRVIEPKKKKLKEAEESLADANKRLAEKQKALKQVEDMLEELKTNFENSVRKAAELENRSIQTQAKLGRAGKLVSGLSSEAERWKESAQLLEGDLVNLVGNIILSAGCIAYIGPFTLPYRQDLVNKWHKYLKSVNVPVNEVFSLERILADPVEVREWTLAGLPQDQLSIDNAIFVTMGRRWPLIIDPQGQANRWVKNMGRETLKVIKLTESNFLKTLEHGIRFGNSILLENVEERLDPSLEPVLLKQIFKKQGQQLLRLGDQDVPYSPDFRFYITTKLPNPHYLPEICIKVTIINFTVTPEGLEDQLLVYVVKSERPELEDQKNKLIVQISNDKDQLQELEDKILQLISDAQGDILDNEELIETLAQSKSTSEVIHVRMREAEETARSINAAREIYRVVATRGSMLYFVIADMGLVDPMYQYSLEFFSTLFRMRLEKSEKAETIESRLEIMINDVTRSFYLNICRGLFEKDKLLYSFMNTVRIVSKAGEISTPEWNYFLRGIVAGEGEDQNFDGFQVEAAVWAAIKGLDSVNPAFKGLPGSMRSNPKAWHAVVEAAEPFASVLPEPYQATLSNFQKFMLISFLKQDKLISGVRHFVKLSLGEFFIVSPPFDLRGAFNDSTPATPIIFVLSPGADPIGYLLVLAKEKEMDGPRFKPLSLGQGQGKIAEKLIENGRRNGEWICLQNCHLASSWMNELERIQENQGEDTHPDFRLWLTSMPSLTFPVPVLQSGIKLTNEPPKGIRANLIRTYNDITDKDFGECVKGYEYHKLLFSLAFFHAVILERRKFGAIGWNIPYEWMNSDFITSQSQVLMYLNEQPHIPYTALRYLVAEINYGGRVTDDKDVRLIIAILAKYFTPEVMEPHYLYSSGNIYENPDQNTLDDVKEYINKLPLDDDPQVFGLHPNADITFQQKTVREFRETLIVIHPRASGGTAGKSPDEIASSIASDIESRLPMRMDTKRAHPSTFAITDSGAMNSLGVFLAQEISRFNALLSVMQKSLGLLQKAIRGDVVMSLELEKMYNCFLIQKVPQNWQSVAYPSLRPLASWVRDLIKRVEFINEWLVSGPRPSYWLSAFFFPQGFMTAALQTYARKTRTPIDTLRYRTEISTLHGSDITEMPANGVNIHGLFLQGAKWDWTTSRIEESDPEVLFVEMPVIWLEPFPVSQKATGRLYQAPLYKTSLRAGELSTTGHSTNFVLFLDLPSEQDPLHWIRRGAALLCQLDD